MSVDIRVDNYKTKNKSGFTASEIDDLLKYYPTVNPVSFLEKMGINTFVMVDGQTIFYKQDVKKALKLCLNG